MRGDQKGVLTARLSRPHAMSMARYPGCPNAVNGPAAWELFCAAAAGDMGAARSLLEQDPDLVNAQYWYQFPIHMAVREGHAEVVQLLLDAGADPGLSYYMYNSWEHLLQVAMTRGHAPVADVLQRAMAQRFGFDPAFLPLRDAIRRLDDDAARSLLTASPGLIGAADAYGTSALHWAVLTRQLKLLDSCLELGADIEARRADGQTPAHCALLGDYWYRHWASAHDLMPPAPEGRFQVLQHLLGRGAAYELSLACAMGDEDRVGAIMQQDPQQARRRDSCHRNPLTYAARNGHLSIVELLLRHGADPCLPETLSPTGQALFAAAGGNHIEVARVLLDAGADPNAGEDSSGVCLSIVRHAHPDSCTAMEQLLREHGAVEPPWTMDTEQIKQALDRPTQQVLDTPQLLHELLGHGDADVLEMFLQQHAEAVPELVPTDIWGGNLPEIAAVNRLLELGLDPNRANWIGRTFLHVAAEKGRLDVARALLAAGADLEATELEHGSTALGCAVRAGQTDMVRFLRQRGADPDAPAGASWAHARTLAAGQQELLQLLA